MSNVSSPVRYSGDMENYYDPNFTADISNRMRVPKRIRVTGDGDDDFINANNQWTKVNGSEGKLNMYVPDRILVAGGDHHVGTKAPPREIQLETSVLPPDTELIRVQTPPQTIRLEDHIFPTADESEQQLLENSLQPMTSGEPAHHEQDLDMNLSVKMQNTARLGEGLSQSEEMQLLRRQIAKLNRRIMSLELDNQQRQQRDVIMYTMGLAYFVMKMVLWLNRSL